MSTSVNINQQPHSKFVFTDKGVRVDAKSITVNVGSYDYQNKLTYSQKRNRTLDGTFVKAVDSYYLPQVSCAISCLGVEEYSLLMQIVNSESFMLNCYDYEIKSFVAREMTLLSCKNSKIIGDGGEIKKVLDISLSMECVDTFKDYAQLRIGTDAETRSRSAVVSNTAPKATKALRWTQ